MSSVSQANYPPHYRVGWSAKNDFKHMNIIMSILPQEIDEPFVNTYAKPGLAGRDWATPLFHNFGRACGLVYSRVGLQI